MGFCLLVEEKFLEYFGRLWPACRSDEVSPRNTARASIPVVASFEDVDVPAAAPERNNRDLIVPYESRIYFFRSECRLFVRPEHWRAAPALS